MTSWEFPASQEAAEYLHDVAVEMSLLFDIQTAEAAGRINRHYRGQDMRSEIATDVLLHEEEDVIARHVFYGRDSFWWTKDESKLRPLPWPDAGEGEGEGE